MLEMRDWFEKNIDTVDKKELFKTIIDLENLVKNNTDNYTKIIQDRDTKLNH